MWQVLIRNFPIQKQKGMRQKVEMAFVNAPLLYISKFKLLNMRSCQYFCKAMLIPLVYLLIVLDLCEAALQSGGSLLRLVRQLVQVLVDVVGHAADIFAGLADT